MQRRTKLTLALASMVLVCMWGVSQAGIDGSDHDLGGKICQQCHIPHNAQGEKLWFETPSGTFSGIMDLCYSCHDGSPTTVGLTTVFNATKEQHKLFGTSSDCDGCHDPHEQNPALTGKFTHTDFTLGADGTYCSTCHDATPYAGNTLGDHTSGTQHYTSGTTFTCYQCHTMHGATPQTTNPSGITNPILLADNEPGAFYGAFCISCHDGTAPAAAGTGTGGVAASDVHDYTMATTDGSELAHPTTAATIGGCDYCHDPHQEGATTDHILLEGNNDSAYCRSCHTGGGGTSIGSSHPDNQVPTDAGMNAATSPFLPWSDEINDDDLGGVDYAGATADLVVCESCHSVHRKATDGPFLRDANAQNELCGSCHPGQY
jgi:predicted CXXCH cytochrome family protein